MPAQMDVGARNASLDSFTSYTGGGSFLRIYDDSVGKPASCSATATGVLLVQFTLATPFAPPAVNAVLSPTIPAQVPALASGTALYYRIYKANGTTCTWQDDVVTSGDGLVLNPSNNVIVAGMPEGVNSWTRSIGGA